MAESDCDRATGGNGSERSGSLADVSGFIVVRRSVGRLGGQMGKHGGSAKNTINKGPSVNKRGRIRQQFYTVFLYSTFRLYLYTAFVYSICKQYF